MYGMVMTDSEGSWRYMACPILSDSYFTHSEIETINVHVYITSGYIRGSVCTNNPLTGDEHCDSSKDTSGTGEVL